MRRPEGPEQIFEITRASCGLHAWLVVDDTTLGPAAGGVRTRAYPSSDAALADAQRLARAMTIKCALAGLDAGGGKCVVIDHPGLDRTAAFAALGDFIESLGGRFRTAGDLGTTAQDVETLADHTRFAHPETPALASAVARGCRRCAEGAAAFAGWPGLQGRSAVVQGAGTIGAAVARALADAGMRVGVADLDGDHAAAVARAIGGDVVPVELALEAEVDLEAPCALGGAITSSLAGRMRARIVCGAANNVLASAEAAGVLRARGIVHVPDVIASAGAVIEGIGASVMGLGDRGPLIEALGRTAQEVLEQAQRSGETSDDVAVAMAEHRIRRARAERTRSEVED